MSDNQEEKIGMTDGDDNQELQPTCMRAFDGWISVDDKLPPTEDCGVESIIVIAASSTGSVFCAFMERISNPDSWTDAQRICNFDVTHWRPLPPPPFK